MAAFAPSHQVFAAAFIAQVTVRDRRHELDPLGFGQSFNRGVTNDRGDVIRPLDRRHRKRGIAVARERASLICVRLVGDQHLGVPVLEPNRQHSRIAVEPDETELADDRAAQQLGGARIYCFLFQSNGHNTKKPTVPARPRYVTFAPSAMRIASPARALMLLPSLTTSSSPSRTNSTSSYLS